MYWCINIFFTENLEIAQSKPEKPYFQKPNLNRKEASPTQINLITLFFNLFGWIRQ